MCASHLVWHFKQHFSVFKQYYTYFNILFNSHVFLKNTNNVIRTTLPNKPLRIKNSIFILVGSKNSAVPTHFIQGPRPMPRRKKHPRMNKESPSCQKTSPRTILSSANQNRKKEERHAFKDSLPGRPKQKILTQWASHESMVKEQFQEKAVTSALNAHS